MSELRPIDEASRIEVEQDGFKCVLYRWFSDSLGEWFTSVNVTYPDGGTMHAGMSTEPCTVERAYADIELAMIAVEDE